MTETITHGVYIHSSGCNDNTDGTSSFRGGFVARTMYDGWCPAPYSAQTPQRVFKRESAADAYADRLNKALRG